MQLGCIFLLEYLWFILAVFPLKCGFIIVQMYCPAGKISAHLYEWLTMCVCVLCLVVREKKYGNIAIILYNDTFGGVKF